MDILSFLMGRITAGGSGGGGGSEAVLIDKTISANGVYNASDDNADGYKKVTAQVPNSYEAADEGKVVSSGTLVAQTAHADVTPSTSDQTIDTTLNNSIKVIGDADLVAGNIKKDVQIFGVTGSYEGGGITIDEMASGEKPSGDIVIGTNIAANAFYGRTAITGVTISGSTVRKTGGSAFYNCTGLTKVFGPLAWDSSTFRGCSNLVYYISTANESLGVNPNYGFYGCSKLQAVDLSHRFNVGFSAALGIETFRNCSNLNLIVLRENQIFGLGNANCFTGTPFASGGAGGDIYIPKALYDALGTGTNDYKAASNWSTIDGYGTITWHAIEGSYYETHYADGTVIS